MTNALSISSSSCLWYHYTKPTSRLTSVCLKIRALSSPSSSLSTSTTSMATKVGPAVIVGGGRVGRALQEMGSGDDLLVKRGEAVPLDFQGPILVCTRNDDLDAVLDSTPKSRWNGTFTITIYSDKFILLSRLKIHCHCYIEAEKIINLIFLLGNSFIEVIL